MAFEALASPLYPAHQVLAPLEMPSHTHPAPSSRGSILPSQTSTQTPPRLETTLSPALALTTCPILLGARSLRPGLESSTVQQPVLDSAQDTGSPHRMRNFLTFKFSQENVLNPLAAVATWGRLLKATEKLPMSPGGLASQVGQCGQGWPGCFLVDHSCASARAADSLGSRGWTFRKQTHFSVVTSPGESTEGGITKLGECLLWLPLLHLWAPTGFALAEHHHHGPLTPTCQVILWTDLWWASFSREREDNLFWPF